MFLKITSNEENGKIAHEALYETGSYKLLQNKDEIIITLDNGNHLEIKGEKKTVYIMNNEGKTIDTICWKHK